MRPDNRIPVVTLTGSGPGWKPLVLRWLWGRPGITHVRLDESSPLAARRVSRYTPFVEVACLVVVRSVRG